MNGYIWGWGKTGDYGWGGDNNFKHVSIYNATQNYIVLQHVSDNCTDNHWNRFNTYSVSWLPNAPTVPIPPKMYWSAKFAFNTEDGCGDAIASELLSMPMPQISSYETLNIYTLTDQYSNSPYLIKIGQMKLTYNAKTGTFSVSSNMLYRYQVSNQGGSITISKPVWF